MSVEPAWRQADGLRVGASGLVGAPIGEQREAEVEVQLGVVGAQPDGLAEQRGGVCRALALQGQEAEQGQGLGVVRLLGEHRAVLALRGAGLACDLVAASAREARVTVAWGHAVASGERRGGAGRRCRSEHATVTAAAPPGATSARSSVESERPTQPPGRLHSWSRRERPGKV